MTKKGFVHTVFFWLKNPASTEDQAALQAGLDKLSQIDIIREAYVGRPADTNREVIDSSYDFSITFIFETAELQEIYQDHPEHHEFIHDCAHLWQKVQVYDAV